MLLLQRWYNSDTALNRAMKGGHAEVVKFLLSQGAKVSAYLGIHTYNSIMRYRSLEIF